MAKQIAFCYVSQSAALAPDPEICPGLTDDGEGGKFTGVALELQSLLEEKPINLNFVRTLLDDLFVVIEDDLNLRLKDMVEIFTLQPNVAVACGAIGTQQRPGVCDGWDDADTTAQKDLAGKASMQELLTPFMDDMRGLRSDVAQNKDPTKLAVYTNTLTDVLGTLMQKHGIDTHQSKTGTIMQKKKGKIHLYHGHPFTVQSFRKPTFCANCGDMLWGIHKQGWECVMCGMTLHKNNGAWKHCCQELKKRCPGAKPGEIKKIMKQMSTRASAKAQSAMATGGGAVEEDDEGSGSDDDEESGSLRRGSRASFFVSQALPPDPVTKEPKGFSSFCNKDQMALMKKMYGKSKEVKRQELMYELIQTEKGYYRHLLVLKKIFKHPFELPKGQKMLSKADCRTVFGNIEGLLEAHKPISDEIAAIQREGNGNVCSPVPALGQRFLDAYKQHCTSPIYQAYCVNAPKGRELLLKRLEENPEFNAKISEMESNPDCGRLSLKDFLVKPYQRLTKYPLLFKDIREALMPYAVEPKKDDKVKRLTQAEKDAEVKVLEELEEIGKANLGIVNQAVADSEDRQKLQEVNGFLKDDSGCLTEAELEFMDDLHIGRKLELDGEVNVVKKSPGSKKPTKHKVRLMLLTDMLLILEQVGSNKKGLKVYKPFQMAAPGFTPMMMLGAMVLKNDARSGGKNGFFVLTTAKFTLDGSPSFPQLLEFDADTKTMCKKWKEAIDRVSKDYKSAHPTWEKDLAETAAHRRAAKSATIAGGKSFKESMNAMGRRASMQSSQHNPRADSGSQRSSSVRSRGGASAPASPAKGTFYGGGASSPLRPGSSVESGGGATNVDMAELEAELKEARQEIAKLKAQNETLTNKLAAAQHPGSAGNGAQLALQNKQLAADNRRLQAELAEIESELVGPDDNAAAAASSPPPSSLGRSGSYMASGRAPAPTMAPPPPPPSSASKPPLTATIDDGNPFPDNDEEYINVDASPGRERVRTISSSLTGFQGFDGFDPDGQPVENRDSLC